jgi:hypothetical protein
MKLWTDVSFAQSTYDAPKLNPAHRTLLTEAASLPSLLSLELGSKPDVGFKTNKTERCGRVDRVPGSYSRGAESETRDRFSMVFFSFFRNILEWYLKRLLPSEFNTEHLCPTWPYATCAADRASLNNTGNKEHKRK